MSHTKNTYRFFVDNKRVATAVSWQPNSGESCILEVCSPPIKNLQLKTFDTVEEWQDHCERYYVPKPSTRVEITQSTRKSTTQSTRALNTVVVPNQESPSLIVCRSCSGNHWTLSCPIYSHGPEAYHERQKKIQLATEKNKVAKKDEWICPPCGLGPGNDHRMCICRAFNFSVAAWEEACGIRKAEPETEEFSSSSSIPISKNLADWTYSTKRTHTFPPGRYFIGDLCYALEDSIYESIFGGFEYEQGFYKQKNSNHFFLVANTYFGDGLYTGSDGKEFGVDAGVISILPVCTMMKNDGGHIYDFKEPVECTFFNGKFSFISGIQSFSIKT